MTDDAHAEATACAHRAFERVWEALDKYLADEAKRRSAIDATTFALLTGSGAGAAQMLCEALAQNPPTGCSIEQMLMKGEKLLLLGYRQQVEELLQEQKAKH